MASSPTQTGEHYRLGWRTHRPTLINSFEKYFSTQFLTDVTLASEGRTVNCHKVVLAACSPFFEKRLLENDSTADNLVIMIPSSIKYSQLMNVLEYMYKGEVDVTGEELAGFLAAAKKLELKGIADADDDDDDAGKVEEMETPTSTSPKEEMKEKRKYKMYTQEAMDSAIQSVREGMSAHKAAGEWNVPSRTLYERLKEVGIYRRKINHRGKKGGEFSPAGSSEGDEAAQGSQST